MAAKGTKTAILKPERPTNAQRLNPNRDALWWKPEPGAVVQGIIRGRFPRPKKPAQHYVQIELTRDASWDGGQAGPGTLVNMDERADLTCLASVEPGREVYIEALEKIKLDGGKTMWRFEALLLPPVALLPPVNGQREIGA